MNNALARALLQLAHREDANQNLLDARDEGSFMATAIVESLSAGQRNAYDAPHAFEVFIRGGGNPALYDAVSQALASLYGQHEVRSLLDIGAGDGMALLPALARAASRPTRIDVVEPHAGLLDSLRPKLPHDHAWPMTLQTFLSEAAPGHAWDLAQSTFALQSIPPMERLDSLRQLRGHVSRLAIVEFDVPEFTSEAERMLSMAQRYERAAQSYGDDAPLVAGGFLAPMLLGQLRATAPSNFEQTISAWHRELDDAGYRVKSTTHLFDYSWAPAWLIVADA
ncbi:MAG: hypothetical protein GAK28_01863 [Luteibacter sp.]|uniref:hypothetical protein n=1 Tax=Luteibacter sp. TaxID=1886636 RepID=UPI00137FBE6E|nr:hypothetical protein [Luteibacter sp.]KAF1007224.1 MAG: hypothetical protein GAK28_01863 [Luteibacter sp.]